MSIYGSTNPAPDTSLADGVQRFAAVVELVPEKEREYRELHAEVWSSVQKRIADSKMRNYNIFIAELAGKKYLFSYLEYLGTDIDADKAAMAADPETRRWWTVTDPCQRRIDSTNKGEQWMGLERVFFQLA
jgi:L-rhamnose mutarotase